MPRKILVVDDIRSNREILKNILGDEYNVCEAAHGQEALALMSRDYEDISVVLLDLGMPVMDGFAVLERMRESETLSLLPVIVTTGQKESESEVKALELGANDYLSKPYNSTIIKQRIRNTINLRETAATVNALQRDSLTGLFSRNAFFEKVQEMISSHEPGHYVMACFDVARFKVINDQYGSRKGDEVLRHIAATFEEGFRENGGMCCRVSSDDFAVLYPASFRESDELVAIRERASIVKGLVAPLSFSIGRYVVDDLSLSPSAMYDRASMAANSVRGRYDTCIANYSESMRGRLLYEQEIVTEMEPALRERQFEPWFQPQYNHSTGALIGAEALVRWRHPKKGMVLPGLFVPVFEENGFIYELDKYIWEEACRCLRRWLDEERSPLPLSVNISRYDALRPDVTDVITGLVRTYDIPTDLLRLEITESAFAESTEQIVAVVKRLIAAGFTLEIDDFGSGYSSLNTLKSVPAQVLKLDMRFLEDDDDSQRSGNIIESIVRMAKWLGMSVIAEGVEEVEQANYLKSIGCNYVQGYLYARPMPLESYEALLDRAGKEEKLLTMETVENLDNNAFWDPHSMDALIFNSYVGCACIFEYSQGRVELLRVTDKYAQMIGGANMTTDDALKLDWMSHLGAGDREKVVDALRESVEAKDAVTNEYLFFDLPGCPHETYLRATMRVIALVGDRYLVYCTNDNITAWRQAERREREAAERLQVIMDSVDLGITAFVVKEGSAQLLFANDQYYEMLGYTKEQYEEEVPNPFLTIIEEDRSSMMEKASEATLTGKSTVLEYRAIRRDGGQSWFRTVVSVGRLAGVKEPVQLSIFRDITQERQVLDRLRMMEAAT